LGGAIPNADAVYSSPMKRALATAATFADHVVEDKRLVERDYGNWEGKTRNEIVAADPQAYHRYRDDPVIHPSGGGETGIDVFMRSVAFLTELLQRHTGGTITVVAHGGSGSALIAALINGGPAVADCIRLSNCSISEVLVEETRRRLVRLDDHSHLPESPLRYPDVESHPQ